MRVVRTVGLWRGRFMTLRNQKVQVQCPIY